MVLIVQSLLHLSEDWTTSDYYSSHRCCEGQESHNRKCLIGILLNDILNKNELKFIYISLNSVVQVVGYSVWLVNFQS